jgi:predicted transcriptional regulator
MNFEYLLSILKDRQSQGVTHFTFLSLAQQLNCSTIQASKYLNRLHQMGFLSRKKYKRLCTSKRGKICYKGYYYEYSLSSQGEKYFNWMKQVKPLQEAMYINLIESVTDHLSIETTKLISTFYAWKQAFKFKGSNRLLQNYGAIIFALPDLADNIEQKITQIELLEFKCNCLEDIVEEKSNIIDIIKDALKTLKNELQVKTEENKKFQHIFSKLLHFLVMSELYYIERFSALILFKYVNKAIIKDLTQILAIMNFEATVKLLEAIDNRYTNEFSQIDEHLSKMQRYDKALQEIINSEIQ